MIRNAPRRLRKLLTLVRRPLWIRGLALGSAATVEHRSLPLRRDYRTVLDVGANRGQFCLFARVLSPEATIFAFEPNPFCKQVLTTISQLAGSVEIVDAALSDSEGPATLFVTKKSDSSSLLRATKRQLARDPASAVATTRGIATMLLDGWADGRTIRRPALLKIDVQGHEAAVLRGARRTLERIDDVLVETSFRELYTGQPRFEEVHDILVNQGFLLVGGHVSWKTKNGGWEQGDFVYRRPEQTDG